MAAMQQSASSLVRGCRRGVRGPRRIASCRASSSPAAGDAILDVQDLRAKATGGEEDILNGVSMHMKKGEVHAVMGKNGSGKSTLSKVLVGHPSYEVTGGSATFQGHDLLALSPEERAHVGLFLSFQNPVEVPGVSLVDFLRLAYNEKRKARGEEELDPLQFYSIVQPKLQQLNMDPTFLNRNVNEGFSGGEKKRNEILQLSVLEAELAVLDEVDSGLDIDAMKDVAKSVNGLREEGRSLLLITHYQRMLELVAPDKVHVMQDGVIVSSGSFDLAKQIEQGGYAAVASN